MARRKNRKYAAPVGADQIGAFKADVMRRMGYNADPSRPDSVKYEVADSLGVPLRQQGDNGQLRTEDVGRVGGRIGGSMVKEMVRMAEERLAEQVRNRR